MTARNTTDEDPEPANLPTDAAADALARLRQERDEARAEAFRQNQLFIAAEAERDKLAARLEEAKAVLSFYACERNWISGRWVRGDEEDDDADEPVAHLICIDHQCEEGIAIPSADCGDKARAFLHQGGSE